ncbi:hypothetical protein D1007_25088 [Hordeum vulgare]|nr:hypothetical protein D1007_25088 [Hordeum vulgare]
MLSQSVDGTEPVVQEEDVPFQLLIEDQCKKRKIGAFERKKAARLQKGSNSSESGDLVEPMLDSDNMVVPVKKKFKRIVSKKRTIVVVTPRKSPRLVGKVPSPSLGELPGSGCEALVVTPWRSPRIPAFVKPSPMIGSILSTKVKRCSVKCKGGPAKVNKGCKKRSRVNADGQDVVDKDSDNDVLIRYQQGTTRVKDVTHCGIAPLLMYLDCLIHGKKHVVDLRTPRINFMDQGKLCELAAADLVKKGDDDPTNLVLGNPDYNLNF